MTFTCEAPVHGSLRWYSDCYIGDGGQIIEFPSNTDPNTTIRSTLNGSSTSATLTSVHNDNGTLIMRSTLDIIENSKVGPCSVICTTSEGLRMNVMIQVPGNT